MVSFGLLAGAGFAGAYNWASGVYTYNRDAWMTDIQVEQAHTYQEDNLRIQMHAMHRDEVRDLVNSDINKINNSILVATLILSLAGEMLFEGQIPTDCPAFVLNAYMLCLGSASFFLSLSILFGICASSEAYKSAARMLTRTIRPQWNAHFKKLRAREATENTACFEEKPLRSIMMPPLASRLKKAWKDTNDEKVQDFPGRAGCWTERRASSPEARISPRSSTTARRSSARRSRSESPAAERKSSLRAKLGTLGIPSERTLDVRQTSEETLEEDSEAGEPEEEELIRLEEIGRLFWHKIWHSSSQEWAQYSSCMFKCLAFGTKNLLDACGYLSVGSLYSGYGDAWAFWAVQILFTVINIIITKFLLSKFQGAKIRKRMLSWILAQDAQTVATFVSAGPLFCVMAAATSMEFLDRILIPLCYSSHTFVTIFFVGVFVDGQAAASAFWQNSADLERTDDGWTPLTQVAEAAVEDDDVPRRGRLTQELDEMAEDMGIIPEPSAEAPLPTVLLSNGMQVIKALWSCALCWALWGAIFGMDFKNSEAAMPEFIGGPTVLKVQTLYMASPNPYFKPHALVCPRNQVFVADKYRVFELTERNTVAQTFPCDVNGTIADIAATCSMNTCWPVVLLDGYPPMVLDCSTGEQSPLLQAKNPASKIATQATERLGPSHSLFASVDDDVIQYGWSLGRTGWAPLWDVAKVRNGGVLGLDVAGNRLLMFHNHGLVESQDLKTGAQCGLWALPNENAVLGGGCAYDEEESSSSVLVLAERGHGVMLLRAFLPAMEECEGLPRSVSALRGSSLGLRRNKSIRK
eukprot:TRINITY_DN39217_c0_g1_i1.p1 TRINITY_DN39217_c0_g1~~TRINITY_DN39217_c0_g1_i1.p1  ORF type:complete len:808 (-),score=110.33 TRINITY_DN39217_c0_g1_i1:5-2428(-)